jgi:hypothetical protein
LNKKNNEFWLKTFTQKIKSEAFIQKQSGTLTIIEYLSSQNLYIYRKKSSKIPKHFLKNSLRNVAWDIFVGI